MLDYAQKLIEFIQKSPSAFQCCENAVRALREEGFLPLLPNESWQLKEGGKYYITKNSSSVIAFVYGGRVENGFNIAAAHMDSPCICVKPKAVVPASSGYLSLNTEVYGGAILSTWFDRPLSLCGRVFVKGETLFKPVEKLININRPVMIIPNLAIHLNREINDGCKIKKQNDMLPIAGLINKELEKNDAIIKLICDEININKENILDFELYLYEYDKGCIMGINNDFISSSRLDDLMMCFSILNGFLAGCNYKSNKTKLIYLCDNEEIGSQTPQGAKGSFLRDCISRICLFSENRDAFYVACENSAAISADLAHGLHPSHADKYDPTNKPVLGSGVCLKYSSNKKYSTNSLSGAVFSALCKKAGIPMQSYANNSDIPGGTTIGPVIASSLCVDTADIGAPILSMHSVRELASVSDNYDCLKLFTEFFKL